MCHGCSPPGVAFVFVFVTRDASLLSPNHLAVPRIFMAPARPAGVNSVPVHSRRLAASLGVSAVVGFDEWHAPPPIVAAVTASRAIRVVIRMGPRDLCR